jgi:RNA polymerase sigma-70 factor (sigma-E family)
VAPKDYAEYVAQRWTALYRTAYLLTGRRDGAEDLVQEVMVSVYDRWQRIQRMDSPDAYVRKVLLHAYLSQRRTRIRRAGLSHLTAVPPPAPDPVIGPDLWCVVRALPPRQRAVVVLRYYEDLTEADTAAALGCSMGTVMSQCHRALAALTATLADELETEDH